MVEKDASLYLFIGRDSLAKDSKLKNLKQKFLKPETADFDSDLLYAKELNLRDFQEKVLLLPAKAKKRLILIRQAEGLKDEVKEFILKELEDLKSKIVLILDINQQDPKDNFIRQISRFAQAYYFRSPAHLDTFGLSRQIEQKRSDLALRILNQLLAHGEKPERIMGGLRYVWERDTFAPQETKRRLKALLNCDLEIKRGKLKPDFALEKLVVGLCSLGQPQR